MALQVMIVRVLSVESMLHDLVNCFAVVATRKSSVATIENVVDSVMYIAGLRAEFVYSYCSFDCINWEIVC